MRRGTKFWLLCLVLGVQTAAGERLPKLNIAADITVSGMSSGGYMANQFHLAHAETVSGVAIIAGGPYDCAEGNLSTALARCVDNTDGTLQIESLVLRARRRAANGQLAAESDWRRARVWLFHGNRDTTVARGVSDQLANFYRAFVPAEQLRYVTDIAAAHAMPTRQSGNACDSSASPFINACHYDAAGELLQFLLGELKPATETTSGRLLRFEQEPYAPNGESSLADEGFAYIPRACADGAGCKLHIAFHGCQQYADAIGERFVRESGYNEWADSNNLVILYPQTKSSLLPLNPKGCWDWWGYSGAEYATRQGNQVATVATMVQALRK